MTTMTDDPFIADRARAIGSSGIRRIFDLGAQLIDPIDLSIGQPDFEVPANIRRAMCDAINAGKNGYTPTRGIPTLRDRIASNFRTSSIGSPICSLRPAYRAGCCWR